jgi:hypothetical protein
MDISVTYSNKNGTEKYDVILGDVQTNKKFHYNLFSVTKMLLKGYKLEGDRNSFTAWNKTRLIVFDIIVCRQNGRFIVPGSLEHWANQRQQIHSYKEKKAAQKLQK